MNTQLTDGEKEESRRIKKIIHYSTHNERQGMTKEGKTKTTSKGKLDIIILPIKESQAMTKDRDTTKTPKKKNSIHYSNHKDTRNAIKKGQSNRTR